MNPLQILQTKLDLLQALIRARAALWQAVTVLLHAPGGPMPVPQSIQDACDQLDKATNDVAAEIKDLSGQISTGMSQADVDSIVSRLNAASTKLEGLASDASNPVPTDTGSAGGGSPTP